MIRRQLLKIVFGSLLCTSGPAAATTIYGTGGYYSIQAETSTGKQTIANFGHYRFIYDIEIGQHLLFRPSYSIYTLMGQGDIELGYGIDLEFAYLPFSLNRGLSYGTPDFNWASYEIVRPYLGFSFHQRQYQSIQSSYAGLGLSIGSIYQYSKTLSILTYMTVMYLSGPLSSTIREQQLAVGIGMTI
jgi:hypothetical protein